MSAALRLALIATLLAAATGLVPAASANITGSVTDTSGAPLPDAEVVLVDAGGQNAWATTSDATGHFSLASNTVTPPPAVFPGTLYVSYSDRCVQTLQPRVQVPIAADGAVVGPVTFAVHPFCSLVSDIFNYYPPQDATAYVDADAGRVISAPGGIAYLHVPIPDRSSGDTVTYDGAVIGGYASGAVAKLTAPATSGSGPLALTSTVDGVTTTRSLGSLTVTGGSTPIPPSPAGADIELALDVSGSMAIADTQSLRKAALHDLLDRAGPHDRVGAFAFDAQVDPIFALQAISAASAGQLALLGDHAIVNGGGTSFDVAFTQAANDLTAAGVSGPARRKTVILVTDGAQTAGIYENAHLLLAGNPTGRPWPVCVVQMAPRLEVDDVALLRRFAAETGGLYTAVTTAADVSSALDRCLGGSTGPSAVTTQAITFAKTGVSRQVSAKLASGLASAAFRTDFASGGKLRPVLVDPKGRRHTVAAPGSGVVYTHSGTAVVFQVRRPAAGTWKLVLTARALVSGKLAARVRITPVRA